MSSSSNQVTIQSLKDQVPPQSPRKCDETLRCAVLTKSPLKPTRFGKMFSMSLSGKDASSTIRAVCFEESMFNEFKTKESYDVKSFKVKKGFGASSNEVEVLIDHATTVEKSPDQFTVDKKCFTIAAILRKESQGFRFIDITAKVISVDDVCIVGKHPNNMEKRDVQLADESGVITMVLWRQRAVDFEFKVNDVIRLENTVTTMFNNKVMLSTTFESSIVKVEEDIKVPAIGKLPSRKRGLISTSETSVLAIKEFKALYKCVSCKGEIHWTTCSTTFLACSASIFNDCIVLLSCDHQWYSANTGVILHMFDWETSKMQPTEQDLINIFKSRFSVRLDLQRKVIEHIQPISEIQSIHEGSQEGMASKQEIPNKKSKVTDDYNLVRFLGSSSWLRCATFLDTIYAWVSFSADKHKGKIGDLVPAIFTNDPKRPRIAKLSVMGKKSPRPGGHEVTNFQTILKRL